MSTSESSRFAGLLAINLAALIFGCAALFGKLSVAPIWIIAVRAFFAALALGLLSIARGTLIWPSRRYWTGIVLSGMILTVHWVSFFTSVQLASIAVATLTFASFPLFTVIIETVRQGRHPTKRELASCITIICAIALIVEIDTTTTLLGGAIAGLISAVTFAMFSLVAKRLMAEVHPVMLSLSQSLTVLVLLLPFLPFSVPMPSTGMEWFWLFMLGTVTTAVMHQLYLFALKRLNASTCAGFIALEPVYAVIFAAIIFGETITLWVAISGILVVSASFILLFTERQSMAKNR